MIAQLTGQIAAQETNTIILDVNGVGYLVQASTKTLATLPQPPTPTRLLIETVVREDAILLYGFNDPAERDWFRLLTTIQGVGAKVALAILSALTPKELITAITTNDRSTLTKIPGVGPKLAARLLTELQSKAPTMPTSTTQPTTPKTPTQTLTADALSALANLGYRRQEAEPAITRAQETLGPTATLDAIIRNSLRELAR